MVMYRNSLKDLKAWLISEFRKPLVLRGARQVGKTWLVRELAKEMNKHLVELNFEKQRELSVHFESNNPTTILLNLESALGLSIHPENSLLFFDEIQAAPQLFAKLRWFYEAMPNLPVIAAGSLLEFVLERHEFSMPVGRVNYFFIEPLGFDEFLMAKNEKHLLTRLEQLTITNPLNTALHEKALHLFKEYLTVGGMPEAVNTWIKTQSFDTLARVHNDLINTYKDDFSKYTGHLSINLLDQALTAVPKMLTKKFIYSRVNPNARHGSIKQATDLLTKSRLCYYVKQSAANGIPLDAEINSKHFKMILIDVGLVSTLLGLRLYQFKSIDEIAQINHGALTEQAAGQLLRLLLPNYIDPSLYYWSRELSSASAEVDYIIQDNQRLIPIEVKAGNEGKLRSLHQFMSEKPWKTAVRIYAGPLTKNQINTKTPTGNSVNYELISIPFYLIGQIHRLVNTV